MQIDKFIARGGTTTTGASTSGELLATNDVVQVSLEDLNQVTILVNQEHDAGTCTIMCELSYDGTNFLSLHADLTEASFAAGDGVALVVGTLSDANGMPTRAKTARFTASAIAGGGKYTVSAVGRQVLGYA